jgi:putative ABC transport system permease protein
MAGRVGVWLRLYRVALRVLPAAFRARWGADMEQVFDARMKEAGDNVASKSVTFVRSVADVLVHGGAVRSGVMTEGFGMSNGGGGWSAGSVAHDLGQAMRSFRRAPGFAGLAIGTLALGLGATTAMFTVLNSLLLQPLPYADPDRLVAVWPEQNFNTAMVRRVAESVPALESISGVSIWTMVIAGDGADPEEVTVALVSASHFDVLGVRAALGRTFTADEGWKGSGDVAILSHELWMRRYGGDPEIIGRRIPLAGAEHGMRTVIGVLPQGHLPVVPAQDPVAWVPLEDTPGLSVAGDSTFYVNWRIARLAAGASTEQAVAQLQGMAAALTSELPNFVQEEDIAAITVEPLRENRVGSMSGILWLMLGAVSLVLLIACANVANLLLARGEMRVRELAVRRALGARSARIVRQLLTEALVLAVAGGVLGVLIARGLLRVIVASLPPSFPDPASIAIDPWVIGFAAGVSVLCAVVFGIAPALRASGATATEALRQGSRGAVGMRSGRGMSNVLVGLEVALAVLLVTGATLMLRTLQQLNDIDPGFRSAGLLVVRPAPPGARYDDAIAMQQFQARVIEQLNALPFVESTASIQLLPVTSENWRFPVRPDGVDIAEGEAPPSVNFRVVTPGYFETMGIPRLDGRSIEMSDRMDAQHVAVINRTMAERFWPGADPIGRTIRTFNLPPWFVVGVVDDVKQRSLATPPVEEMYVPHEQLEWLVPMFMVVRVRGDDPMSAAPAIRDAIRAVEPETAISSLETYDAVLGRSAGMTRFLTLLLGSFAGLALALGAVGVYGVTAFTTARRIPEFGVRLALGASRRSVLETALFSSMRPVVGGVFVGCLAAAAGAGVIRSQLFGVQPRDPVTFVAVPLLLGLVGVAAILVPAWRAARLDPVTVLRTE